MKALTGPIVSPLREVKARAAETERGLKNAREIVAVSELHQKTLTGKVLFLTEDLASVRSDRASVLAY